MQMCLGFNLNAQNALDFDGSNDYVQTNYGGVTGTTNRTFEAWIYITSTPSGNMCISDYGKNAVGARNTFYINSSLRLGFISGGTNANISSSANAITVNQWNHVAFVLNNGTGYLYVDGVQVGTGSLSTVNTQTTGNTNLRIGQRVSGGSIPFNGIIEEYRMWNVARTLSEIIADTGNVICPPRTNLVAYHNFNHGTAGGTNTGVTVSADSSGSGNNGTLTNFSLSGTSSNWVAGRTFAGCTPVCYGPSQTLVGCEGYSVTVNGNTYTTTGVYYDTLVGVGCDSVLITNLTVNPIARDTQTFVGCTGFSVTVGSNTYSTTGVYIDTLVGLSSLGCDSIVVTDLTVGQYKTFIQTFSECLGYSVSVGTNSYTTTGVYNDTLVGMASGGCDSIVITDLTILSPTAATDVKSACDSYTWINGVTYTASNTTAKDTLVNSVGCDSVVTLDLTITYSTSFTDVQSACDSYLWIDGNTYLSSTTTATHTLVNSVGCDSVVTLNLTITNSTLGVDTHSACGSYTWINGVTYTSSNTTAKDTLVNSVGCDSVVVLNLTIHPSYTTTDVHTVCDSLVWIDGNTYYSNNNTATYATQSVNGCDSIVTLDLTIINSSVFTDVIQACDDYTWIDGNTYTTSNNTATHTLISSNGCDSVVMLDLTIGEPNSGQDIITACGAYTWIDGVTYTTNTINAYYTLTNASGCDSVVRLFLTIVPVDVTTTNNWAMITANAAGMQYQWIDCADDSPIVGATGQSYVATQNGSYKVEVSDGTCVDTSDCVTLTNVGIEEGGLDVTVNLYPNPTEGKVSVSLGDHLGKVQINVMDVSGKSQLELFTTDKMIEIDLTDYESGVYFVRVTTDKGQKSIRLIKL